MDLIGSSDAADVCFGWTGEGRWEEKREDEVKSGGLTGEVQVKETIIAKGVFYNLHQPLRELKYKVCSFNCNLNAVELH